MPQRFSPWILRQDHPNWFDASGFLIRYSRYVTREEKGILRHCGAAVRCLDRFHTRGFSAIHSG